MSLFFLIIYFNLLTVAATCLYKADFFSNTQSLPGTFSAASHYRGSVDDSLPKTDTSKSNVESQ